MTDPLFRSFSNSFIVTKSRVIYDNEEFNFIPDKYVRSGFFLESTAIALPDDVPRPLTHLYLMSHFIGCVSDLPDPHSKYLPKTYDAAFSCCRLTCKHLKSFSGIPSFGTFTKTPVVIYLRKFISPLWRFSLSKSQLKVYSPSYDRF